MTATSKAAGNGSTSTATAAKSTVKPARLTGMAHVREAETYHTSAVMNEAMFEAQSLGDKIHHTVSNAYFDSRDAVELARSPEIRGMAEEALNCLRTAKMCLQHLLGFEPPF